MGDTAAAIEQQRQLYGAPVGDLVRTICTALGLTQSGAARVLGLSPAMLSQLSTGQRVKIGNPLVVNRLQTLLGLADEAPDLTRREIEERLDAIRESRVTVSTSRTPVAPAHDPAGIISHALRAVASGRELAQAAAALESSTPGLADLIRVYGTGTPAQARAHWESIRHLHQP